MNSTNENDLLGFVSSLRGGDGLRVEETLGGGYVRLRVSEAERRQAKHDIRCVEDAVIEMLRNARDAGATRIFTTSWREGNIRSILMVDDGDGIPRKMHDRVFDARVTSKLDTVSMDRWGVHGRGMALYSIAQNACEARVIDSDVGLGTSILASFDLSNVTERADQSTWPTLATKQGKREVHGPNNIARACVEFALETKDKCNIYYGSPSEIVATMHRRVEPAGPPPQDFTARGVSLVPVCMRPSWAGDARQMRMAAHTLGIEMSERTAHRIIKSQIAPLRNVLSVVSSTKEVASSQEIPSEASRRMSLSQEDMQELKRLMEESFEKVASRYYFSLDGEPKIRVEGSALHVTFTYKDDE